MVAVGVLMLLASWLAWWQLRRRGEPAPWLARVLVAMTFSGWVATLAGWFVTEIGRQPWLVTGILRTADAASSVGGGLMVASHLVFVGHFLAMVLRFGPHRVSAALFSAQPRAMELAHGE